MRRFFKVQLGRHGGDKRERSEQQSDRAENHHQNGLDLGRFEVQKVMLLNKNALCLYLELCFLQQRGVHFQESNEKKWSESEKWSQNCVGYVKIPPRWGRMHEDGVKSKSDISVKSPKEAICSKNTRKCDVF